MFPSDKGEPLPGVVSQHLADGRTRDPSHGHIRNNDLQYMSITMSTIANLVEGKKAMKLYVFFELHSMFLHVRTSLCLVWMSCDRSTLSP